MISDDRPPMVREARQWFEVTLALPDGERRFQQELMAAVVGDGVDPLKAVGLAYAALYVASSGHAGIYEIWYRERAMALLESVGEALAAMRDKSGASVQ